MGLAGGGVWGPFGWGFDASGTRVNIQGLSAEKSGECLARSASKLHGETRGGGDGGDDGDASRVGFLEHFEGCPPAEEDDVSAEGEEVFEERPTEDFIEGVVSSNILSKND